MDEFLNYIYSQVDFDKDFIYRELSFINIPNNEMNYYSKSGYGKSVKPLFDNIADKCDQRESVVFPNGYWLLMISKNFFKMNDKYIKLYLPVKYSNIVNTVSDMINFLDDEQIPHNSKLASEIRNDNFIIRLNFDDKDRVNDILEFVEDSNYERTSFNKVSPFLPSIDNVGIMIEDGYSYNSELARIILDYLKTCAWNKSQSVSKEDLKEYIEYLNSNNFVDKYTYETFMSAYYQEKTKNLILNK